MDEAENDRADIFCDAKGMLENEENQYYVYMYT